jgi:hypothetical protein
MASQRLGSRKASVKNLLKRIKANRRRRASPNDVHKENKIMAKTAKRQAARDKVKAKAKAKAAEMITARKSSRKKKKGR